MTITEALQGNTYPGRGIIVGQNAAGRSIAVYFIMGRSENSRNRVFEKTDDGIRTKAFDPEKLTDPSLVIYHPIRMVGDATVVTNGDQTDTIRDFLQSGRSFYDACMSRIYEPDPPIWTPRISGMIDRDGSCRLAIVKNIGAEGEAPLHCFYEYSTPVPGVGHFIRTYQQDGSPPASFSGEPLEISITGGLREFAKSVWEALDETNRVALYVTEIGTDNDILINKHGR